MRVSLALDSCKPKQDILADLNCSKTRERLAEKLTEASLALEVDSYKVQTLAEASDMLTDMGIGGGVWEEVMAEKEKWGSGLGKGEANRVEESRKTDEPEGVERNVLGGMAK